MLLDVRRIRRDKEKDERGDSITHPSDGRKLTKDVIVDEAINVESIKGVGTHVVVVFKATDK